MTPPAQASKFERSPSRPPWRLIAVAVWLVIANALAGWWLMFGLRQLERLSALDISRATELARQHRMLMSEGLALFALLLAGGASLLYYIWIETKRAEQVREFFAAFTHDLKTSLASVRLQAESLDEDLRDTPHAKVLRRLVKNTVRLELQLENSLFVAAPSTASQFLIEDIPYEVALARVRHQWPDLSIEVAGRASARADSRALESILKNLIQNSVVHGKARLIRFVFEEEPMRAVARIEDDGRGFDGDLAAIGAIFSRHAPTSGSGIGLALAMRLARQMGGALTPVPPRAERGFAAELSLPLASRKPARLSDGASGEGER